MSISIQHVSKSYGSNEVLKDISFTLPDCEIVGFLGPNGAGKSTTMKILTGFLPPDSGTVAVCGIDMMQNPLEAKRCVGYLPEHNPLYLDMYVREYLEFAAGFYDLGKGRRARIDEMMERTGLTAERRKKIRQLSKGYRQRVGLAQALIHDPKVLILDEPTTGLDPNQLIEIRNLILELGREKTVLLSTHIMQEVQAVCNRVLVINKGMLVADKAERDFGTDAESGSRQFVVEFSEPSAIDWTLVSGEIVGVRELSSSCFELQAMSDIRVAVSRYAFDNHILLLTIKEKEPNVDMEKMFVELTK